MKNNNAGVFVVELEEGFLRDLLGHVAHRAPVVAGLVEHRAFVVAGLVEHRAFVVGTAAAVVGMAVVGFLVAVVLVVDSTLFDREG